MMPRTAPAIDISRYDVRGPRYTSYPTALQFSGNFSAEDYRAWWPRDTASGAPLSLYVHVPFCRDICYYCACNKIVTRKPEAARQYLGYLKKEIALQGELAGNTRPVTQLHFGGGTPTYLNGAELTELVYSLANHFHLNNDDSREYSIEIDPRTVDRNLLALLKGLNFNRISFGVQDFDPAVQKAINRIQPLAMVAELTDAARAFAFDSINFDLIYGLPLQSANSFVQTLHRVINLRPDRIALYNYAHMPERFPSQRALDRLRRPAALDKLLLLNLACEMLQEAGYLHIGMDHFVLPGDALARAQKNGSLERNFQGYSTSHARDLIGLGVSAIGSTAHGYAQNAKELPAYYALLDENRLPIAKGLPLNADDRVRKFAIMQIICNLKLDFAALRAHFDIDFHTYFSAEQAALRSLCNDGLLTLDDACLSVTERGRFLLRNICMVFDRYLPAHAAQPRDLPLQSPPARGHSRTL